MQKYKMESDCKYLFVYGTLLNADNEYGAYLNAHSTFIAKGYFNGALYNLGEYPGALYQPLSAQKVWGDVVLLDNPIEVLKVIDEYEGYGPDEEQPNLFARELVAVTADTGLVDCWVYLYNLKVDGLRQIESGNYK